MKKIKAIIASACTLFALSAFTSCNQAVFDTVYTYDTAYVAMGDKVAKFSIDKWTDYADGEQLQIWLVDGTVMLVSANYTVLCNEGDEIDLDTYFLS